MKYLGIDFGEKHLGLALADGPLAEPFGEKFNNQGFMSFLQKLVEIEKIEKVIVGMPEGRLEPTVKEFGNAIKEHVRIPVIFADETLSSQEARQKLIAAGAGRIKRRQIHAAAAALILQQYLDMLELRKGM